MRSLKLALAPLLCLAALAGCGDDDDTAPDPAAGEVACEYAEDGAQAAREVELPPSTAEEGDNVPATIETNVGALGITLDAGSAPCTVNSFLSLAEQGYFDDTQCHRLVTEGIYVLQCGDPTATGTGGPGYTIEDELTGDETYPARTLAMANTGQPDTGGSQFFVVYADSELPPQYTVFGTLDEDALAVVEKVAAKGAADGAPDGPPKEKITITGVTLK
ncbi:peptidylprolyl isomerase [Nocardioides sp. 616]|uniref:peptidylprolyl isomerase n=1 Tax=Nocardioides sp. 616 TaxID=2268090 RepID=UPI000CE3DBA8|nr:peptidylprolyl isomerase [Nocardioides sp. 616]